MTVDATTIVVRRLRVLYQAAQAVPPDLERRPGLNVVNMGEWVGATAPSRIDNVLDRRSGLEYAVWCVGETVAAMSGIEELSRIFEKFEALNGSKAATWLNSRWNGVSSPGGSVWRS